METWQRFVVLTVTLLCLAGCREYNIREFETARVPLSNGELIIQLPGRFGEEYEKDGKQYADYGAPYGLTITFLVAPGSEFDGFAVRNIVLENTETGNVVRIPSLESGPIKDPASYNIGSKDRRLRSRAAIGDVSRLGLEYSKQRLTAQVLVRVGDKEVTEEISVVIDTNSYRTRRSDRFDELMSV